MGCSCLESAEFRRDMHSSAERVATIITNIASSQDLCDKGARRFLALCLIEVSTVGQLGTGWIEAEMAEAMAEIRRGAS